MWSTDYPHPVSSWPNSRALAEASMAASRRRARAHAVGELRARVEPLTLRDRAAIVGIGQTEFSKASGRSELQLAAEASWAAIDDAGLAPRPTSTAWSRSRPTATTSSSS